MYTSKLHDFDWQHKSHTLKLHYCWMVVQHAWTNLGRQTYVADIDQFGACMLESLGLNLMIDSVALFLLFQVMVESLRPEETLREVSVRADLPQLLFRKLRQEYMDMGYGCFPDAN